MSQPPDLRLAIAALAGWLALLWGLSRAAGVVALGAVLALGSAVVLLAAGRRNDRWYRFGFAAAAIALVLAPLAARLQLARNGPVAALAAAHTQVTADLVVTGDPHPLASTGVAGSPRSAIEADLRRVVVDGRFRPARGSVLVLAPSAGWQAVLPGQLVRLDGRLAPPLSGGLLAASLSANTGPQLLGRPPPWQRAAGAVRAGLRRACVGLPTLVRGLLPGLVDGDTSQLDPVLASRFQTAGLTHLVAVSGTNLSILVGTVALLLRRSHASPRTIALTGAIVVLGFVIIARPSPSVLRAAAMASIALVALATGRQRSAVPVLAAASLALLVWHPDLAANLGFALSVSATAALLLIAPGWAAALGRRGLPAGLAEPVAVAAAAHLVTVPLIAGISGRISLVAIPANLLAEPVVAATTVIGLLAALCSVCWLPAATLLAAIAGWPCRWLVWVAEYFGALPGGSVPWPAGVAGGLVLGVLLLGGWWLCRRPSVRTLVALAVVIALLVQVPVRSLVTGWPPAGWLMVVCDVGQGDAIALNAGGDAAIVVDAGPDPVKVDRCLRQLKIRRVPLLVLTHAHLDHVGGLVGVLHDRAVGQVFTTPLQDPQSGHRLELSALADRRLPLHFISAGAVLASGGVRLDVLGPTKIYRGTRSDPNNSSVVMRATIGGVRIMLAGDAEVEAQDDLLAAGVDLRADILKVAHHGSAYSDRAFLQAVHARLAVISVGAGNDYGHPSPLLLDALARLAVPVRRTDQDGDIAVVIEHGRPVPIIRSTTSGNASAPARTWVDLASGWP